MRTTRPMNLPPTGRSVRPRWRSRAAGVGTTALLVAGAGLAVTAGPATPARAADPTSDCIGAVVAGMSPEQRVGQLFMAGVDAGTPTAQQLDLIRSEHLGGVILTGRSSAGVQATRGVTDRLRSRSGGAVTDGVGLWVATDQEGGSVQVLSGPGFSDIPTALTQGGLAPADLRGRAAGWGRELRAAGVDLDLAPVLDTVPADLGTRNRPIGYYAREYAHDPGAVAASGTAFAAGLRDAAVQATGKHFPGLGRVIDNTDTTAGVTDGTTVRGDAYLAPFAAAVDDGIPVVMVSSATYTRIDPGSIAAFSPVVIDQMLRGDLGFGGVVMSDSLGAAALRDVPVADRAVRFLQAGGTVALSAQPGIVAPMIDGVLARVRGDSAFAGRVDAAVATVLRAKYAAGLVACPGAGPVPAHYAAMGGASSYLGAPVGGERPVAGGVVQQYAGGAIYWSAATGAHAVTGAILARYRDLGGPAGFLGFPATDETGTPDGVGRYNHFSRADGASIYWSPGTGAHAVIGAIRGRWAALGWEAGPLGYPTTDETATPDGAGRYNHFSRADGASIYWSPRSGAHAIVGAIRAHWADLGWEQGVLGYPTTDETGTPDGVGRFNHFTGTGGSSIYWTPATGAHDVLGAIRTRWAQQGWELGPLGYPVSDEYSVSGGRRESDFQGGSLIWPFRS